MGLRFLVLSLPCPRALPLAGASSLVSGDSTMGEKKIVGILPNQYVHVLDLVSSYVTPSGGPCTVR